MHTTENLHAVSDFESEILRMVGNTLPPSFGKMDMSQT